MFCFGVAPAMPIPTLFDDLDYHQEEKNVFPDAANLTITVPFDTLDVANNETQVSNTTIFQPSNDVGRQQNQTPFRWTSACMEGAKLWQDERKRETVASL